MLYLKTYGAIFTLAFCNSLTFFTSIPFLGLLAVEKLNSPVHYSATITALFPLVACLVSLFLKDFLSSKKSRRVAVLLACLSSICFLRIGFSGSLFEVAFLVLVMGLSRGVSEPISKSIFSTTSHEGGMSPFQVRYIAICAGASVGPLLGAYFWQKSFAGPFILAGFFGLIQVYVLYILIQKHESIVYERAAEDISDQPFRFWVSVLKVSIPGFLIYVGFSQFDSLSPLILHTLGSDDPGVFFARILALNAILGILFQPITMWALKRLPTSTVLSTGSICFFISYFVIAEADLSSLRWIIGVTIFSLGEALALPSCEILVDEEAPKYSKEKFFAASEFKQLGFFVGPILGGLLIEKISPYAALITASATFLVILFYLQVVKSSHITLFKMKNDQTQDLP